MGNRLKFSMSLNFPQMFCVFRTALLMRLESIVLWTCLIKIKENIRCYSKALERQENKTSRLIVKYQTGRISVKINSEKFCK